MEVPTESGCLAFSSSQTLSAPLSQAEFGTWHLGDLILQQEMTLLPSPIQPPSPLEQLCFEMNLGFGGQLGSPCLNNYVDTIK